MAAILTVPLLSTIGAGAAQASQPQPTDIVTADVADAEFRALVFSKTAGFRHASIPAGISAIQALGEENGFEVDATEDAAQFTEANLANYDVVIWLSTTGDVLNDEQQAAFEGYIQAGGGYAGIHAASDTEYSWPWYEDLVGAYFKGHPANQNAEIIVEDNTHPSTAHLGDTWTRFDEWYDFRTNPRSDVHVLMSLDESSYTGATMGLDHPIAWCQTFDGGRAWYTGGGHTNESFAEPAFLEHLLGGIRTAAGAENAACNESNADAYEVVQLDNNTANPMTLTVTEDSTVFYVERNGRIQRIDPETQQTTTALTLPVTLGNEDGMLGMVLDPDFETNQWAYVYWSPQTVTPEDGPHNRLSRFTYNPANNTFDAASETTLLKVTTQRDTCCHAGGDMVFDLDGNLILATGDNTNPFESSGYTPIDERPGRTNYDAQATSGNTNDLRGKLIRITPQPDGTYTVPEGNLFEPGTAQTREEIYAMGFRNPFRIGLDPYSGNVLVADYGPDAGSASATRGPAATTEWNIVSEPGNYGWPYCHGVKCYNDFNFANNASGAVFDPNNLVNNSPNNTGLTELPPVIWPEQWGEQGAASTNPWREIGNGSGYTGAPMAGPVYQYDADLVSDTKWPEYWDNKALFGDWNAGQLFTFQLNRDGENRNSEIVSVKRLFPEIFAPSAGFYRAMDMEFGPDGSLYVIDWGQGFGGDNASSGIYRVDYVEGNPSPIARASADTTNTADESLTVTFSSEGSRHPADLPITYSWNFGDGSEPSTEANPTHTYTGIGEYTAQLTVTDPDGRTGIASVQIVVGNAMPTVNIVFPENGGFFEWGDEVAYQVVIDDPDASGPIDCSQVQVLPALGHDSHQHPWGELSGCEGSIPTGRDAGHGITSNIFWVVDVRYTDDGGAAGVPLTGYATNLLTPKHQEAEFFVATGNVDGDGGVETETTGDAGGGLNVTDIQVGDWWSYEPINFKGIDGLRARLAVPDTASAGEISLRWNDPSGPEIGTIPFTSTGGWQTYQYFDAELGALPAESGTLYFVLASGAVNVNYYDWIGKGVDGNALPIVDLEVDTTTGPAPLTVNATASATDPEGTEVTYQWLQGNGGEFTPGEASESFVYDTPGTFLLTVRATDEQGAYADASVQITVAQPDMGMCFSGRSDGFDGPNLDNERWNRIVRPNQDARIEDGHLVIPASKTDIYGNGGNTPNLILQDLPSGAFQATTKVTIEARASYQQAGLLIYGDDDNYAKLVIQGRNGTAEGRIIQFIREENAQPNEVAASNTDPLGAEFPDTVYLRFTSDGTNLTAAYSADGSTFTEMPETKALAGISNPRIGLTAFANSSSAPAVIDAKFDWFSITPDDTASVGGPNDEFEGAALDACRWEVLNPNPNAYRVVDGQLQIDTANTDIYEGATGVENFIVQNQPGDEWTVETKVDVSQLDRQYQQGGLIVYTDDDNYVKLDVVSRNAAGSATNREIEFRSEIGGAVQNPQPNAAAPADGIVWLRLAKSGDVFTGAYSTDGESWTTISETLTNTPAATGKVGLFAIGSTSQGSANRTVSFDYFRVLGGDEELQVSHELDPAEPNGDNDWYTGPVEVTVNVTGGGDSSVYREVKVDDGDWAEYTAPVTVSTDGEHVVEYRASGPGSEPVTGSVSFKIDATAPTSTAAVEGTGAERTLTLTGEDETSGVAVLEYRIGDGEWTAFTEGVVLAEGAQTVTHRAVDQAGNVSDETVLEVPGDLDVSVTATTRCTAGKVFLALLVRNAEGVPVAVTLESAYGTKSFPAVKAEGTASHLFATRAASIEGGTVTVTLTATVDGEERTSQYEIEYGGAACG